MAVHKLTETAIPDRLKLVAPEPSDPPEPVQPKPTTPPVRDEAKESRNAAIVIQAASVTMALAKIVSARFILLLAVAGAFALSAFVIHAPTWQGLVVLALYALLVVSLVALEGGLFSRLKE